MGGPGAMTFLSKISAPSPSEKHRETCLRTFGATTGRTCGISRLMDGVVHRFWGSGRLLAVLDFF